MEGLESESEMYYDTFARSSLSSRGPISLIIQPQTMVANSICSTIRAFNTSEHPYPRDSQKYKPDITFYDINASEPESCLSSFQKMEMFVEFKRGDPSDPFYSYRQLPFEELFDNTCTARRQIALCSTRLQAYQFRTWAFSVGIFGDVARLFRWDRAGAIVSEPIPYTQKGNRELAEFLCRFDIMNRTQRGFDPTVFDASPEEAAAFEEAIKTAVKRKGGSLLKELLGSVGNKDDYPRRRIEIPTREDDGRIISYILGRPIENARLPTGRSTRCFVAMSKDTEDLVFLKDSWRLDIPDLMGETHWFGRLDGARNVCVFLHGSDVRSGSVVTGGRGTAVASEPVQRTLANLYSEGYGRHRRIRGYIHYRTVQCEFYLPLDTFKDSKHLVQIMLDVVIGTRLLSFAQSGPLNIPQRYRICMIVESFMGTSARGTL